MYNSSISFFRQKIPILLASGSPRRKQILEQLGFHFRIVRPQINEDPYPNENILRYVRRMALEKGQIIRSQSRENSLIIAADTIVSYQDQLIGKPSSQEEAYTVLKQLNNSNHLVITAYYLSEVESRKAILQHQITKVSFKNNPDSLLYAYCQTNEPIDKAGSYGIQGMGRILIEKIDGSYSNVVGLPIERIFEDLLENRWIVIPFNQ